MTSQAVSRSDSETDGVVVAEGGAEHGGAGQGGGHAGDDA